MYLCLCRGVTDAEVRRAVQSGCQNLPALQERLEVAVNCGSCAGSVQEVLRQESRSSSRLQQPVCQFEPALA